MLKNVFDAMPTVIYVRRFYGLHVTSRNVAAGDIPPHGASVVSFFNPGSFLVDNIDMDQQEVGRVFVCRGPGWCNGDLLPTPYCTFTFR